jgi:hypothetical protein
MGSNFADGPTSVTVKVDGYGVVKVPAISLSPDQARHLATTRFTEHPDVRLLCLSPTFADCYRL